MKANIITTAVIGGIENAKILYKFAKGELTGVEAADAMGMTTSAIAGGTLGAMGVLSLFTPPVGWVVGAVAGGVGALAGSKVGEKIYQAGKEIVKTGATIVKTAVKAVADVGKAVVSGFKNVTKALFSWC
jgi:hypothetical protein